MVQNFFHSIIMLRFGNIKVAKETFYSAKKPQILGMLMLIIYLKVNWNKEQF